MCPPVIFKTVEALGLTKVFESSPPIIGILSKHCMQFIDGNVKMEIISVDFQGSVTDSVTSNQVEIIVIHHI